MLLFKHRFSLTPAVVVKLFTLVNIRSNRVKSPSTKQQRKIGKAHRAVFPTADGVEMSYDRSNDEHFMRSTFLSSLEGTKVRTTILSFFKFSEFLALDFPLGSERGSEVQLKFNTILIC